MQTSIQSALRKSSVVLCLLLLASCGGGGGGSGGGGGAPRATEGLLIQASDGSLYVVADDGSGTPLQVIANPTEANDARQSPARQAVATRVSNGTGGDAVAVVTINNGSLNIVSSFVNPTSNFNSTNFPMWAPNGSKFVVVADGDTEGVLEPYIFNANGTGQTKVPLTLNGGEVFGGITIFSPDGRYLAYNTRQSTAPITRNLRVLIYDTQTRQTASVDINAPNNHGLDMRWSPNSQYLAYNLHDEPAAQRAWRVFTVRSDGSDHIAAGTISGTTYVLSFAWSADSRYVATQEATRNLVFGNGDAQNIKTWAVTDTTPPRSRTVVNMNCRVCFFYEWSATGARLAFNSNHDTSPPAEFSDLYIYDADTHATTRIDRTGQPILGITAIRGWLNDGNTVFFRAANVFDPVSGILAGVVEFIGRFDNTTPVNLNLGFLQALAFSPTHRRYAVESFDSGSRESVLQYFDVANPAVGIQLLGPSPTQIVTANNLIWSKDESRLIFRQNNELYGIDLATGTNVLLSGTVNVSKIWDR